MSLRLQLILLTTLVLLVSLIIGGALAYGYARSKVQTEMRAAIAVGERLARNAIDDAGASADPDQQLRRIVTEFDGDRHLRASWVDGAGRLLASSKLVRAPGAAPEWLYRLLAGRPNLAHLPLPPPLQDRGSIELKTDPHNEIAEAWDDVELTLTTMSIFCCLVLLLTSFALGYALRPMRSLSAAFARVGGGNYGERVAEKGPLELSRLCRGFNQMLDHLSDMEAKNLGLQEQLAAVQDEERADLARDLHDEVGPFLFAVGVDATMIQQFAETGTRREIAARSVAIREATEHMQKHIRAMLGRLRPGVLIDVGLRQAVDNLIMFWRARQPGIAFETSLPEQGIKPPVDEAVYRIIQESLSNAIRHGRPGRIEISVTREGGEVLVGISDDGKGFQPLRHKPGYGLAGMEERIRALDGTLAVRVRPGGGVTVSARLPEKQMTEEADREAAIVAMPI
ncbi:MAG: ATP-binding protein [Hyphomicrobiales bacterium]